MDYKNIPGSALVTGFRGAHIFRITQQINIISFKYSITGDVMPYLICKNCNIYHEVKSLKNDDFGNCECGALFEYYDSMEEYLYGEGKVKPSKQDEIIDELINSYESTIARIILYSLNEMPFSLNVSKTINVLRGSKAAFITNSGLNMLSTYSIFYYFSRKKLKRFIESLIENKLIERTSVSQYQKSVISLTKKGDEFLLNDEPIKLDVIIKKNKNLMDGVDEELYRSLRYLRNDIANDIACPVYWVCNNGPLLKMARSKPKDYDSMISIRGIGKRFMEKYGEEFLKIITGYCAKKTDPNSLNNNSKEIKLYIADSEDDKSEFIDLYNTLLNDHDANERAHAAFLMGESGNTQYVEVLCNATRDEDPNVRRLTASALDKMADERAENNLINLLEDSMPQTRQYAANALGKIKSFKALIPLKRLRSDPVQYVKHAAEKAISKINEVEN